MSLDFTVIPRSIAKTIRSGGYELSEEQYMLMSGALAAIQQMIDTIGLESTIEVLEPMSDSVD